MTDREDNQRNTSDEAQVIEADFSLKKKIKGGIDLKDIMNEKAVVEADKKMQETASQEKENFKEKAIVKIKELQEIYKKMATSKAFTHEERDQIESVSIEIKSYARMFEYHFAEEVASLLYGVVSKLKTLDNKSLLFLKAYIDALHLVFKNDIKDDSNPIAQALLKEFQKISSQYKD